MPELPEVETIRTILKPSLVGKIISDIEDLVPKQFIGNKRDIIGKEVLDIKRNGKVLILALSDHLYLNIHLKLSGQLVYSNDRNNSLFDQEIPRTYSHKLPAKTTRIIIDFTDGSALYFNDLRKFGWIKVTTEPITQKGVDVSTPEFTLTYFKHALEGIKKPIKAILLDQDKIAGIGNIYANDALFEAHIHPLKSSADLTQKEIKDLYLGIKKVIAEGIQYKGSSSKDQNYILPDNQRGGYQHHFRVYSREKLPCLRCQTPIKRIKQNGRSSFYCPHCQTV